MACDARLTLLLALALGACGGGTQDGLGAAPASLDEAGTAVASSAGARNDSVAARAVVLDSSLIPEPGEELERETFSYLGGSRDPFASLLEGRGIGPELGDLDVVGLLYVERDHRASTAVLRDRVNRKQYSAREGERVGRARVISIGPRTVTFLIDDYGTQREVTLAMRKREEVP
ncbi:MAG: hypothetical protein ACT4PM_00100 [Gemmatimonadales bacterium]